MSDGKGIIRTALGRALFDAPPILFDGLRWSALQGRARPVNPFPMLARRIVDELQRDGYTLTADRHGRVSGVAARMRLEDHLIFGIETTERQYRERLDAVDRTEADVARTAMTAKMCESLTLAKAVLGHKRP